MGGFFDRNYHAGTRKKWFLWAIASEQAVMNPGKDCDFIWYLRERTKAPMPALNQEEICLAKFSIERHVTNKAMKWIPVNTLVTERSIFDSNLISQRRLKRNINRDYRVIRITKNKIQKELLCSKSTRRGGMNQI